MPKVVVDIGPAPESESVIVRKPSNFRRWAIRTLSALFAIVAVGGLGFFFYWDTFKTTPQYSLALVIDAARRDDKKTTDELIDINAVVDDFIPQITSKAVEMYGRGLPPETIGKIANIARPLMPALKDRARAELPRVIRERTERFQTIPFAAMVIGADRYLDIKVSGDNAVVKSKLPDKPFEISMKRSGTRWVIAGIKDENLAAAIAQKVGQEIVAIASKGGINSAGETLGIKNLSEILKQAENVFGDEQ